LGATVARLDDRDLPDLIVGMNGKTWLAEVKRELGPRGGRSDRDLREGQRSFAQRWKGTPIFVLRCVNDALVMLGCASGRVEIAR
jgi:hypothetical protein